MPEENPVPPVEPAPQPEAPAGPCCGDGNHEHQEDGKCKTPECQCIGVTADEEKKFHEHINKLMRQMMDAGVRGDIGLHDKAFSQMLLTFSDPEMLKQNKAIPPWQLPDDLQRIILFTGMRLIKQVLVGSGAYQMYIKALNQSQGGLTDSQGNPIGKSSLRA